MAVLPGVLGRWSLRRTVQVRLGTNTLRFPGTRRKRLRCAWHAHLRGLATAIHEITGLVLRTNSDFNNFTSEDCELLWSTGGMEIPNHKSQISNKSQ